MLQKIKEQLTFKNYERLLNMIKTNNPSWMIKKRKKIMRASTENNLKKKKKKKNS